MPQSLDDILGVLPDIREAAAAARETLLANLVMVGEIPAPTFGEERRVHFLQDRFTEVGLQNCSTDEKGNALGLIPGENSEQNILLVAHADTPFEEKIDHTITLRPDTAIGAAVCDNSLGLAGMLTVPVLLDEMNVTLESNLVLMGSARSLGRGNLEGLNFFLDNKRMPIRAGLCVEGVELGRLSHSSIGMLRGEIMVNVPEEYDWTRFGAVGAIMTLNDVIDRIVEIPFPKRPRSSIIMGSIEGGGQSFNVIATKAVLRFEIRSESAETVEMIQRRIEDIVAEVSSQTAAEVTLEILAQREPGGITFSHPLVRAAREVMKTLEVPQRVSPSISELAAFIEHGIPAVTLGLSHGEGLNTPREAVRIEPIFTGLAQLVGMVLAVDRGLCDEQ